MNLDSPLLTASRQEDGSLVVGGIRLVTPPPAPVQPTLTDVHAVLAKPAAAPPLPDPLVGLPVCTLKKFSLTDARLLWHDDAMTPTVDVAAHAAVDLTGMVIGKAADPAHLHVTAGVDGALDDCTVDGDVSAAPDAPFIKLTIAANGLRAGPLAAYVPAGIQIGLKDGRFKTNFEAGASFKNAQPGVAGRLIVSDLDYRDGVDGAPMLKLASFKIIADRVDPPAKLVSVDEISLAGLEANVSRNTEGLPAAFGAIIGAPAAAVPQAAATTQAVIVQAPTTQASGDQAGVAVTEPSTSDLAATTQPGRSGSGRAKNSCADK